MLPRPHPPSLSREAEADFDAAVEWYIGEGAFIAANDFLDEVERAMSLLVRFPKVGETVRIIAIAHHSRRPGYWMERR